MSWDGCMTPPTSLPLPPDKTFNGVYGKNLTNPQLDGTPVPVGKESDPTQPNPDPGEPYQDVYCQLYGVKRVPALAQVPPNPPQPPAHARVCLQLHHRRRM